MERFTVLTGIAAPLLRDDVDTDVMIRIERLVGDLPRRELGYWCFESWRYRPDGSENPDFILNRAPYRGAQILLAGANFGCGSSREGAVWALTGMGLRAVIAPSFRDIFFDNCFQNGLLPVVMAPSVIAALARAVESNPASRPLTVDLRQCCVVGPQGESIAFAIDGFRRDALLAGADEIGATLGRVSAIAAFQAKDRPRRPWIYDVAAGGMAPRAG